jgi:hypothetical protein
MRFGPLTAGVNNDYLWRREDRGSYISPSLATAGGPARSVDMFQTFGRRRLGISIRKIVSL